MIHETHDRFVRRSVKSRKLKIILWVFILIFVLLFHVGVEVLILSYESRIREIKYEQAKVDVEIKSFEMEITTLCMGSRIKKIASESLGMVIPEGAPEKLF